MLNQVQHDIECVQDDMKKNMNIIFFGNTKYSVIVAKALNEKFGLTAIVTIPPHPLGRKKVLTPNPVHQFGLNNKILVITVEHWTKEILNQVQDDMEGTDFFVVADYGRILPKELLSVPKYAPLNVHQSLLPKYRGTSPAPAAILNGDTISGVTVIEMNEEMDTGDIVAQKKYELKPDETTDSLLTELNRLGGELIIPVIKEYMHGTVKKTVQQESKATWTKKLTKDMGYIRLDNPPDYTILDQMIRAFYPWPSVWTTIRIKNQEVRIKILPGKKIQVEGKKPVSYKDFVNGYPALKANGVILNLIQDLDSGSPPKGGPE